MSNPTLRFSGRILLDRVLRLRIIYLASTEPDPADDLFRHAIRVFGYIEMLIIEICVLEEDASPMTPGTVGRRSVIQILELLPVIRSSDGQQRYIVMILIQRVMRMRHEELVVLVAPEEIVGMLACSFEGESEVDREEGEDEEGEGEDNEKELEVVEEEEDLEEASFRTDDAYDNSGLELDSE